MAWKVLLNEVEFLAQFPMVGLAISDSPSPIPGYLYGEINAITYVENGIHCKPLAAFLVSRLQSTTPFIATKVLKLLLYLVQNGHEEFINAIKFHEVPLKEAMGFHGPPDDLHGRTFYENIRKMAKELLEFIFAENKITGSCISQTALLEMGGYGSTASLTKMPGFGHTVKTQSCNTERKISVEACMKIKTKSRGIIFRCKNRGLPRKIMRNIHYKGSNKPSQN